jgi:aspartate kinase
VAEIFGRHEIVIDMIATSEVSLAMTTDPSARLDPVVAELSKFADVAVKDGMSLVSVVGEELRERADFVSLVFAILARLKVNLELISYGATRNNLAFVVAKDRLKDVTSALHQELFGA